VALFCFGTASGFGWILAYYQIPRALLANVSSWGMGITEVGFFIAFVFLVLGCFLDAIPPIIIVGTTLEPLARSDSGTGGQSQLAAPQTGSYASFCRTQSTLRGIGQLVRNRRDVAGGWASLIR